MRRFMRRWWKVTRQTEPPRKYCGVPGFRRERLGMLSALPGGRRCHYSHSGKVTNGKRTSQRFMSSYSLKQEGEMFLGEGWVSANIVHRNDQKTIRDQASTGIMVFPIQTQEYESGLHSSWLRCWTAETCRLKGPWRPQGWGHYMHYMLLHQLLPIWSSCCTWLTEVMAYDTSYQLSALRSFPVHLTSGDPNWSHWVVVQALTSGFIQVSLGYHDLYEWEPTHIK